MQAVNQTTNSEITSTITSIFNGRAKPHERVNPPDTSYLEALAQVAAMEKSRPTKPELLLKGDQEGLTRQGLLVKTDQDAQGLHSPNDRARPAVEIERAGAPSRFFAKIEKVKAPYHSALKVDPAPRSDPPGPTLNAATSQHPGCRKKARIDDFSSNQAFGVLIITKPESQPGTIGPYHTYLFNPQIVADWVNINNYSGIKAVVQSYGGQSLQDSPHKVIHNAYEVSVRNSHKKSFYETERKNLSNSFWAEPHSGNEFLTYTATWGP